MSVAFPDTPETVRELALKAAQAVLADPRKHYTLSTVQVLALCHAVDLADRAPVPAISNELAEATRAFIAAHRHHNEVGLLDGAAIVASAEAFRTFSTLFETEFPDV